MISMDSVVTDSRKDVNKRTRKRMRIAPVDPEDEKVPSLPFPL